VKSVRPALGTPAGALAVSKLVQGAGQAVSVKYNNLVYDLKRSGRKVIVLSLGEAFFDIPPVAVHPMPAEANHYSHSRGLPELRERLARYYEHEFEVAVDPASEILVTAGSKAAIYFALMATLDPGDEIVIQEPLWVSYPEQVRLCRGVAVQIPYDSPLTDFERYLTERTRGLIVNNPNNPRGRVYRSDEVRYLVDLAKANGLYVLSDESYSDFVLDERFPSAGRFDPRKSNVIVCNSLSKNLGVSGWRLGYVIAHGDLIDQILKLNQHVITCAPAPLERIVATSFDEMRMATRPQIEAVVEKRAEVARYLDSIGLEYLPGTSTFYLFVSIAPTELDSDAFCTRLLQESGVAVVPGIGYGDSCDGFVRVSVGTEPLAEIRTGLDRLKALVESTSATRVASRQA
jgi:aminotransferase